MRFKAAITGLALAAMTATSVAAAPCGNNQAGFSGWLKDFRQEAAAAGISRRTLDQALKGVAYSSRVIKLDRSQRSFKLSFAQFYARRVNNAMISKGKRLIKKHRALLTRIERKFGVPAPVIVAIWGLETGFGRDSGKMAVFRSLATLAYDCRRAKFFTNELMNALIIVQRGDMAPAAMRGAWAGEIGQTQFLASSYVKYAVDFDGNRRADLIRSVPDVLASTANYLRASGWRTGAGWGARSANYAVIHRWNTANVYVRTISTMADKLSRN